MTDETALLIAEIKEKKLEIAKMKKDYKKVDVAVREAYILINTFNKRYKHKAMLRTLRVEEILEEVMGIK